MFNCELIVLSYHRFTPEDHDYIFSRTYKQFRQDLETKDFDWITIDDGHRSQIKACKMMQDKNFRAKLFTTAALVGTGGYCSWDDLWTLSRLHDIENHGFNHLDHTLLSEEEMYQSIHKTSELIKNYIGRSPRYFVPPYNLFDDRVETIAKELGLVLIKNRVTIKNISR
jgi:peptidoglycan/xylan/chitin deacetylase (PgdA/CDA1 family)